MSDELTRQTVDQPPENTQKTRADPLGMVDQYCLDALADVIRSTKSRSGALALLSQDGASVKQVFIRNRKKAERLIPPVLEPSWSAIIKDGVAQTISNRNPFTRCVVVPYYSGDNPVLLYVVSGRLWPYGTEDIAQIATFGRSTWGELERMRYIDQLEQAYELTIQGWAQSLEEKERPAVLGQYHLAAEWAAQLGRAMHLPEASINHLRRGAVLHDIGKMSVPENILQKNGTLTADEWAVMRRHPTLGAQMVESTLFLSEAKVVIQYHHERWDGKGYPHGLKGEKIPLLARIFSVVDVYDALISDRPYSPAWPRDMVLAYIRQESGQQFDPLVVEKFLEIVKTLRML